MIGCLAYLIKKAALRHEELVLKMEAQAHIGTTDGVEGLFEWPSHEKREFQHGAFRSKYLDLYDEFRKVIYVRRFKLWGVQEDDEEDCEVVLEQD